MPNPNDYALIGYYSVNDYNIERVWKENRVGLEYLEIYDQTETDVAFMNSLYRNSNNDYFLGSWIVKPVVEILLHYTGTPNIEAKDKELGKMLNETYDLRQSNVNQLFREAGLYGETYGLVGYDDVYELPTLKVKNKNSIIEIRYENFNDPDEVTYVRIRENITKYKRLNDSDDKFDEKKVVIDRIYWKEDNEEYQLEFDKKGSSDKPKHKFYVKVIKKEDNGGWSDYRKKQENPWQCVPLIPFHLNRLSSDKSGYSDANGLVKIAGAYHQVMEAAIDVNIYNGKPTLVFSGLKNAEKFVDKMYGEINPATGDVLSMGTYELFGAYYLEGDAAVDYLQVQNTTIEGAIKILELLFYIFVQVSGVPEWALGAHIEGAWASAKMQSTPLVQKVRSKRLDLNDPLLRMNYVMAKVYEANNDDAFSSYITYNNWNEPLPEDKDYILQALSTVIPLDILTNETILTLLDVVANPKQEINKRKLQKQKEQLDETDKAAIVENVKGKLTQIKDAKAKGKDTAGEMEELEKFDFMLKVLLGEDYLDELGLEV